MKTTKSQDSKDKLTQLTIKSLVLPRGKKMASKSAYEMLMIERYGNGYKSK